MPQTCENTLLQMKTHHTHRKSINETKHNSTKVPDGTSEQVKMCNLNDAVSYTFIHLSINLCFYSF